MKKKAVIKTFRDIILMIISVFIIWFLLTFFFGKSKPIQPGSAHHDFERITLKEATEEIPTILLVAIGGGIFFFPIQYKYNLGKLKKEEKEGKEQEEKKEEGDV